jgi:hypothetical protein
MMATYLARPLLCASQLKTPRNKRLMRTRPPTPVKRRRILVLRPPIYLPKCETIASRRFRYQNTVGCCFIGSDVFLPAAFSCTNDGKSMTHHRRPTHAIFFAILFGHRTVASILAADGRTRLRERAVSNRAITWQLMFPRPTLSLKRRRDITTGRE